MNYMISAFLVLLLSFFIPVHVDTTIDPYQKENLIVSQAFELDEIIQLSYKIERLPLNARKLDAIINDEMQATYTNQELRELSYDTLLMVSDELVMKKLNLTQTKKGRKQELFELTKAVAREQKISPTLFAALVKTESDFNPKCISNAGAIGLAQIMPENFKKLKIKDPFNILQNLRGGANFYKEMFNIFDGHITLALAAYNAGSGAVQKYNNQVPPYEETIKHIEKVVGRFREYKNYEKGIKYAYTSTKSR